MLGVWNEILVGLQHVRAIANIGIFFSDERAEFIDFDEGAGFGLWWACWECLGSLDQPARDCLVVDPENPADSSHPHPFEIELTGLLLEGWIFASS